MLVRREQQSARAMVAVARLLAAVAVALSFFLALSPVLCDDEAKNFIASDDIFDVGSNKFLQRQAREARTVNTKTDEEPLPSETCPVDLELAWMTEVSASVYATPLVTDLYSDGHKDVVVPAFVNYLEVLEGGNGAKVSLKPNQGIQLDELLLQILVFHS